MLRDEYDDKIVYLFGDSNDKFKHLKAEYTLYWNIIRCGINRHMNCYDFYGIGGIFSPEDEE